MRRTVLLVLAAIILSACDGYIEEARIAPDGSVEFAAEARVDCQDDLQQAIWGENPCEQLDIAARTGEFGELPLDVVLDPNRVAVVSEGEADRRVIDARWSGDIDELESLLVVDAEIRSLDDERTEVVMRPRGNVFERLLASTDPEVIDELRRSRWDPAQFRIRAPDQITEHNADRVQGRIVVWNIDEEMANEFRVVWTTEEPARQWWWWILISVLFLGILIMMVTIEGPAQNRAKRARAKAKADQREEGQPEGT